jgi:hypothetical protein
MADRGGPAAEDSVEEAADALYAAPPAEFVAARDEAVRAARERGDRDAARRLAALRRPTTSAWLVNLLYRDQREAVEALLELGEQLTEASRRLSGPDLQQLSAQRSQVVQALVVNARRLAAEAKVPVSATVAYEVQSTLSAALADPAVAQELRSGQMLRPASYAGFGPAPEAGAAAPSKPAAAKPAGAGDAEAARRRARAENDVAAAEAALEAALAQLEEPAATLADARRMCELLAEDHEALTAQLADLEHRQQQAAERAVAAERAHQKIATRRDLAQRRLDEARARLDEET